MYSKKPIWFWRAKSVRITKSLSLTVEDSRSMSLYTGKTVLQPAARKVIKKLLRKKRRGLQSRLIEDGAV